MAVATAPANGTGSGIGSPSEAHQTPPSATVARLVGRRRGRPRCSCRWCSCSLQAAQVGWSELSDFALPAPDRRPALEHRSLTAIVTTASAIMGTAAAFATERTRPARPAGVIGPHRIAGGRPRFRDRMGLDVAIAPSLHGLWGRGRWC